MPALALYHYAQPATIGTPQVAVSLTIVVCFPEAEVSVIDISALMWTATGPFRAMNALPGVGSMLSQATSLQTTDLVI